MKIVGLDGIPEFPDGLSDCIDGLYDMVATLGNLDGVGRLLDFANIWRGALVPGTHSK